MTNENSMNENIDAILMLKKLIRNCVKEEIKKIESVTTDEQIQEMIDNSLADFVESTELDVKIDDKCRDTFQNARVEINTTAWVEVD